VAVNSSLAFVVPRTVSDSPLSLWSRLRQRKLVQWGVAYLAAAWALLEVTGFLRDTFGWPPGLVRGAAVLLAAGFLVALVVAWYHGERGRQRVPPVELVLVAVLLLAGGAAAWRVGQYSPSDATTGGSSARAPAEQGSIAVLPFVDMSSAQDQEYFSDGITEELLNVLAQVEGLRVAARTSSFQFKGQNLDVREIGDRLGVRAVLEGSVRKAGDQVRITAQLNDASNGYHLWSETYDRELRDVFALQDEIAGAIVDALRLRLVAAPAAAGPVNPDAHDAYLQGLHDFNRRSEESLYRAIEQYGRAIELDPTFGAAHAALALTHAVLPYYSSVAPREAFAQAEASARRALAIDPRLAAAHTTLGYVRANWEWDLPGAAEIYRQALALNPNFATARQWYAEALMEMGHFDAALDELRRARLVDPLSVIVQGVIALNHYVARNFDEAIHTADEALRQDSSVALAHMVRALSYSQQSRHDEASASARLLIRDAGASSVARGIAAYVQARAGDRAGATAALRRLEAEVETGAARPMDIALVNLGLGDHGAALDWLERAADARDVQLLLLRTDPRFDPVRNEARFRSLLGRIRFEDRPATADA
jgi:TolB-like protein/Flp pilus assembly protein TadD